MIRDALGALGADASLVNLATRAIDDELRHAEICRVVASRYAGRDLPSPARLPFRVPSLVGAPEKLRLTLHIVGNCAINETTATVFLEASLKRARGPLVRAALRELLADDVDHARIGWAHYASLSPSLRAQVDPWIKRMLDANAVVWRGASCPEEEDLGAHGWVTRPVVEAALQTATRDLIIPGLARFGGDTTSLQNES